MCAMCAALRQWRLRHHFEVYGTLMLLIAAANLWAGHSLWPDGAAAIHVFLAGAVVATLIGDYRLLKLYRQLAAERAERRIKPMTPEEIIELQRNVRSALDQVAANLQAQGYRPWPPVPPSVH